MTCVGGVKRSEVNSGGRIPLRKNINSMGGFQVGRSRMGGYTLIEMLIAATVVGIIAGFTVPVYFEFIQQQRVNTSEKVLVSLLRYAQSEAIKTNTPVSMCIADATGTSCDTDASARWNQGSIVFTDPNSDQTIATADEILRTQPANSEITLIATAGAQAITFAPTGEATGIPANFQFGVCDYDSGNLDCNTIPDTYHKSVSALASGQFLATD